MIFCASICFGSGNCTRMPFTSSFGVELRRSVSSSSASLVLAGNLWSKALHAGLGHRLGLVADIDLARRIVADQHDGNPRHDAAIAPQPVHGIRDLAAQIRRDRLCRR